jgi:hypothetical protein
MSADVAVVEPPGGPEHGAVEGDLVEGDASGLEDDHGDAAREH